MPTYAAVQPVIQLLNQKSREHRGRDSGGLRSRHLAARGETPRRTETGEAPG